MSFPRWVAQPALFPARCAVLPSIGSRHPAGYIDTGSTSAAGERVYISVVALGRMAEGIGYRKGEPVQPPSVREVETLRAELKGAREDVETLQARLDAIHTLKLHGATEAAKPGRPRKQVA